MRSAAAPIFFRAQVHGIGWSAVWLHIAAAAVEAHGQVAIACRWHGLAPAWAELAPLLIFTVTQPRIARLMPTCLLERR